MLNEILENKSQILESTLLELQETAKAWNDYYKKENAPAEQAERIAGVIQAISLEYFRLWNVYRTTTVPTESELQYIFGEDI